MKACVGNVLCVCRPGSPHAHARAHAHVVDMHALCRTVRLLHPARRRVSMRALLLAVLVPSVLAEQPCEDSPALTTIWESTSTGNSDRLIDTLIQNHDFATHRSSDCRGPLFWAFEFKNVDALALYMHLEVDLEQTDQGGQLPKDMFDGSEEDMQGARLSLRTHR